MKTRGKGKTDVPTTNYAKDAIDSRDFGDDGDDTNGYPDDRADEVVQARSESRSARNPGNRRGSRIQRPVNTRGKSDKNLMESQEFQDVVRGFFDFIEEIKRKKKKDKNGREPKPLKPSEEPERIKKPKLDPLSQAQQAGKSELRSDDIPLDKTEQLYSFKQDGGRELLDLPRDKKPGIFPPPLQSQDDLRPKETAKQKDAPLNKLGFPGANYLPSANLPGLNTQPKPQANKPLQNLYFDNPALFPDRMQLQGFPEQNLLRNFYMSPYDNYPYGVNSNQLLNYQLLEALLQKNQPELLASLLESAQGGGAFYDLQREAQRFGAPPLGGGGLGNQRFGNQSWARLMDNGPEPINPKGFEGKLGRAATHVAIAYFIYFKSLDPDTIAKADKTKMDPTYNARMLKEKRTETFPSDIPAMMGKLGPFYSGLPMDNSYPPNIDYLERRLMEGQRFLRNQDINPALAGYQGKPEKLEEEKAEPKRRAEAREAARQASNKKPPKEEDIINIDENSDVEEKPPQPQATQKQDPKVQKAQIPAPGPVSAEDIVQEIAELTGHSDADKKKNARKAPSKSASEENQKPGQKTFTVEEGEQPVGHTSVAKGNQQKEAPKNIEVILSSDDEVPKKEEVQEKEKESKIEEKIEEKMEEEIQEVKEEEQDKEKEKENEKEKETETEQAQSTEVKPATEEKEEKAAPASE